MGSSPTPGSALCMESVWVSLPLPLYPLSLSLSHKSIDKSSKKKKNQRVPEKACLQWEGIYQEGWDCVWGTESTSAWIMIYGERTVRQLFHSPSKDWESLCSCAVGHWGLQAIEENTGSPWWHGCWPAARSQSSAKCSCQLRVWKMRRWDVWDFHEHDFPLFKVFKSLPRVLR